MHPYVPKCHVPPTRNGPTTVIHTVPRRYRLVVRLSFVHGKIPRVTSWKLIPNCLGKLLTSNTVPRITSMRCTDRIGTKRTFVTLNAPSFLRVGSYPLKLRWKRLTNQEMDMLIRVAYRAYCNIGNGLTSTYGTLVIVLRVIIRKRTILPFLDRFIRPRKTILAILTAKALLMALVMEIRIRRRRNRRPVMDRPLTHVTMEEVIRS